MSRIVWETQELSGDLLRTGRNDCVTRWNQAYREVN